MRTKVCLARSAVWSGKSLLLFLIFIFTHQVFAQETSVSIKATISPFDVTAASDALLSLQVSIPPGYHAYRDMLKLQWTGGENLTTSSLEVSPIHTFLDPYTETEREVIEDQAYVKSHVHFPTTADRGPHKSDFAFTYQICSAKKCLLPKTIHFEVPYNIAAKGIATPQADHSTDALEKALAHGKIWAFLFVFLGGILTSLSPCVFPMIPITISIIGARSAKNNRSRSFLLSVAYVLGIAFTYSLLGVIAASSGALFGAALSNVYVACAIAAIFLVMGISMLGFFEIQVPTVIRNKFGNAKTGQGLWGAFLAGLFAGIVASPCVGPVLVSILTYVAKSAEVVFGFALLFTFALGMGLLFILLGTFTGLISRIPKSKSWMNTTKYIFGFLLIGMAFYYLYPVLPSFYFKILSAGAFALIAVYYGGVADTHKGHSKIRILRKTILVGGFCAAVLIASQAWQTRSTSEVIVSALAWQDYSTSLINDSKILKKPVIIDFAASWCVACHELDRYTYTDKEVIQESSRFTLLKVDATHPTGPVNDILKKFNVVGLPTVVFIDAAGVVHSEVTILGFIKASEFLSIMKKIL